MSGSKIYNRIKYEILYFKDALIMLIANLFLKDPCEKCIVKACCSERCEIKVQTINMMLPHKTILHAKVFSMTVLLIFVLAVLSLIISLIETFKAPW